jgi:hypothetical protein
MVKISTQPVDQAQHLGLDRIEGRGVIYLDVHDAMIVS